MICKNLTGLIRCDGSAKIGLGHITRCLALADMLGGNITFAVFNDDLGMSVVKEHAFPVVGHNEHKGATDEEKLIKAAEAANPDFIVFDLLEDISLKTIGILKGMKIKLITIDDATTVKRLKSDICFYPPVPQVNEMDWTGYEGSLYSGFEYVILRKEFRCKHIYSKNITPKIMLTAGGSDPFNITLRVLCAFDNMDIKADIDVILGKGFAHKQQLDKFLAQSKKSYTVKTNVKKIWEEMAACDMAVSSFGVTAYELLAMGIPSAIISLNEDHKKSMTAFKDIPQFVSLGVYNDVTNQQITEAIKYCLSTDRFSFEPILKCRITEKMNDL